MEGSSSDQRLHHRLEDLAQSLTEDIKLLDEFSLGAQHPHRVVGSFKRMLSGECLRRCHQKRREYERLLQECKSVQSSKYYLSL